jgi:hypothetical protein
MGQLGQTIGNSFSNFLLFSGKHDIPFFCPKADILFIPELYRFAAVLELATGKL